MQSNLPIPWHGSWLLGQTPTDALLLVGIAGLVLGPLVVWLERRLVGTPRRTKVRTLWISLAATACALIACGLTEPSLNASTTPPEFALACCVLGLGYCQSLRAGACIQQAVFESGHSAWSSGWLLGLAAFAPLAGLVPSVVALLVVGALGAKHLKSKSPA